MNHQMKTARASGWSALLLCYFFTAHIQVAQADGLLVEVFTDSFHLPDLGPGRTDITTIVYDLSEPKQAEQALANELRLPADPESAMKIARTYLQSHGLELARKMGDAHKSHQKAIAYGISRDPALVINHEAIFYGTTDVLEAVRQYQIWQEARVKP